MNDLDHSKRSQQTGISEISSSFVKGSEIKIDRSIRGDAIALDSSLGGRQETKISESFIKDSQIHVDSSVHTHINYIQQEGTRNSELEFKKVLSETLKQYGIEGLYRFKDQLEIQGEKLGLTLAECSKIRIDLQDIFEKEEKERLRVEQIRKKYRIYYKNRVIDAEPKTLGEVIKFLNEHKYDSTVPKVDIEGDGNWRPVWTVDQIFNSPELELICSRTADTILKADAAVCIDCCRVFKKKFLDQERRCQECSERYQRLNKNVSKGNLEIGRDLLKLDEKVWKRIPAGEFMMGSPEDEAGRDRDEKLHPVRITQDFIVYVTPVTENLYEEIMGNGMGRKDYPMVLVSWFDAVNFCNAFSNFLHLPPCYEITENRKTLQVSWNREIRGIRLLTEAEWEYACRAGSSGPYYQGNGEDLYKIAVYDTEKIEPLCLREPNSFGLHDMLGTVWEWVWDGREDYPSGLVTNPLGHSEGTIKVARGGSFADPIENCRCARRHSFSATHKSETIGFRVCMTAGE
jgi:formylglycine-generating enzyme required for sulfatase activity